MTVGVLLVLTAAGCSGGPPGEDTPASSPAPPSTSTTMGSAPAGEADGDGAPTDPSRLDVPESASGDTRVVAVPGRDTDATRASGRVVRYTVEVEKGMESVASGFPDAVRRNLTAPRGWQAEDHVRFVNVTPHERAAGADTDIRIRFASPALVDRICAPLRTRGRLSCHAHGNVMINAWRWAHGASTYGTDLASYRMYLINHEVGHSIGHGHLPCPGRGQPAPVMLQQTLRLDGCLPNPHPVR